MSGEPKVKKDHIPDIEITPEMMTAGVLAWAGGDTEFETPKEIVRRIYESMILNSPHRAPRLGRLHNDKFTS